MSVSADVVVIGGGFAGAATAYQLSRCGISDVVIVEGERTPGMHSSGRNAAMARFLVLKPDHLPLAVEGIRFLHTPPFDFPAGEYVRRCGSMMLVQEGEKLRMERAIDGWRALGIPAVWLDRAEVERRVPLTVGGTFTGAVYCPDDGVVDISALLDAYLSAARQAGARVLTGRRVTAVRTEAGRVVAVETDGEAIRTRAVVNAAGAWAGDVARMAGATEIPLQPLRRHLAVSGPMPAVDRSWPFVWDVAHEIYFRPEPPGLLLSPCDEGEVPAGDVGVDRTMVELLAEKIDRFLPALSGVTVATLWAGARTFTPDRNFLLGRDARISGFVWCAGLGGNGMAVSAAAGRLAAEAVQGQEAMPAHDPCRFN
jgi:D-arginine dehydrogenase